MSIINRYDVCPANRDSGTDQGLDAHNQLDPVRGFFHFSFNSLERPADHLDAGPFRYREVIRHGGIRILCHDLDESVHLLFGDFQDRPGAVVNNETPLDLPGIDQIQCPFLVRPKEYKGVV